MDPSFSNGEGSNEGSALSEYRGVFWHVERSTSPLVVLGRLGYCDKMRVNGLGVAELLKDFLLRFCGLFLVDQLGCGEGLEGSEVVWVG